MNRMTLSMAMAMTTTMAATALSGCAENAEPHDGQERDHAETPETTSVKLAAFKLSNGNVLTLTELLQDGEIIVGETTPAGDNERFVVDDFPGASPLELFARLAPPDAAVPERLVASATAEDQALWMAGRQISRDTTPATFRLDVATLGWHPVASATPGLGSCNPSTGYQYFLDNHCNTAGPYGYGVSDSECYNAKAFDYWQRSTPDMRHTYTRTAACDGTGWIRHSRYGGGEWNTVLDEAIEANTVATYTSYRKDGLRHDRRARSEPLDPFDTDAYVRMWVHFYDQVTENAP